MLHISVSEEFVATIVGLWFLTCLVSTALGYLINEASRKDK